MQSALAESRRSARCLPIAILFLAGFAKPQAGADPIEPAIHAAAAGDPLALGRLLRHRDAALPGLLEELDRLAARPDWRPAVPLLEAIGALEVATDEVLLRLIHLLDRSPQALREHVLCTIGDLAPHSAGQILGEWLAGRWGLCGRAAAEGFGQPRIRCFVSGSNSELLVLPWMPSESARIRSRYLLRDVTQLGEFGRMLVGGDWIEIELAAECIGRFGPAAGRYVPELRRLLAYKFVPPLRPVSKDAPLLQPLRVKRAAAVGILQIAPGSAAARDAHVFLLREGRPDQQLGSLIALRSIDDPKAVVELVRPLLGADHHPRLRREALLTLGSIGPDAAEAVPQIERIAASDDAELAAVARATLRAVRGR